MLMWKWCDMRALALLSFLALSLCESSEKKIAFLFLTRGPMPLEDIWYEFFTWRADPSLFSIYVHTPAEYAYSNESIFYGRNKGLVSPSQWGRLSQVQSIKSLVAEALKDPLNDRFCLMSESDIPLIPFQRWRTVMLSNSKSVVNACPMKGTEVGRWHSDLDSTGIKKSDWRKSATWFSLIRSHAEVFANETETEAAWEQVPCVDEHYLPTILAWKGLENETTCADGFAYVHWPSASASHPTTFSTGDITPELFHRVSLRSNEHYTASSFSKLCSGYKALCHFTARKFAPHTRFPLLNSLKYILSESNQPYTNNPWTRVKPKSLLRQNATSSQSGAQEQQQLFIIDNYRLRLLPDEITTQGILDLIHLPSREISTVPILSEEDLRNFPQGPQVPTRKNGMLYKQKGKAEIWLMRDGCKCSVPDWNTFLSLRRPVSAINTINIEDLGVIPIGQPLSPTKL